MTEKDEAQISAALKEGKGEILVHGALFKAEKNAYGYKVFIDLHPESTPVAPKVTPNVEKQATPVAKVAANPVPIAPKAASVKPAKKASQPAPTPLTPSSVPTSAKPTTLKKEVVHRKAAAPKKAVAVPSAPAGTGKGATLIVAVPSDDNEREFIERKSRRAAENGEAIHTVRPSNAAKPSKRTSSRQQKPIVSAPKASKPVASKPLTSKEKAPLHVGAKPLTQPKDAHKKPTPTPTPKAKAPAAKGSLLAQAQASEKRLMANYNNPNYPKDHKSKDLQAQMALVKQLPPAEVGQLRYNLAKLQDLAKKL